ncbi:LptF/LptG family permease [Reinekea marinisedimentorum]|uniref:LPS export ABC transporter permease LptG n=1 Tax=Reinekea marinisedimentorum TaxID=230495 RepID=A0A4R3IBN7_9GAMM|nr:LptF/LptG family permease [Reinekea marinisedimentorum]TCS41918.1 LPS export ABC transporter permease LptG [Reinekea marinisedimentorum]
MSLINRYLLIESLKTTGIVILSICGLLLITGFADDAARRLDDSYTITKSIAYNFKVLPSMLYEYIDVVVMLGTLITVASLNKNQELTTIQLVSSSSRQLTLRLLTPALLLFPLIYYMGEWVGPKLTQEAKLERSLLTGRNAPSLSGQWYRSGNEFISIDLITTDNRLVGITTFTVSDDKTLEKVQYSQSGSFINGGWRLRHTKIIDFTGDNLEFSELKLTKWVTNFFTPSIANDLKQYSERLTILQLYNRLEFNKQANTLTPDIERDFWNRVWFPLRYLAVLFMALSFSFGSFRQKTIGDAAFKAIVIGIAAGLLLDTIGAAIMILGSNAMLATLMANTAYAGLAFNFFRKRH